MNARQHEILALLSKGYYNAEIATALDMRESTVKYHVSRILAICGVSNRTELAGEYAVEAAREHSGQGETPLASPDGTKS